MKTPRIRFIAAVAALVVTGAFGYLIYTQSQVVSELTEQVAALESQVNDELDTAADQRVLLRSNHDSLAEEVATARSIVFNNTDAIAAVEDETSSLTDPWAFDAEYEIALVREELALARDDVESLRSCVQHNIYELTDWASFSGYLALYNCG